MKYTIIGAGIGGLVTALAFEQKGIEYELFEKAKEFKDVGAGIWLAPNPLQVLKELNILEEITLAGNTIDRITISDKNLNPISDFNQFKIKQRFGFTTVAIHRAELQKVLLNKIPSNKIHLGKEFLNFEENDNKEITTTFTDGSTVTSNFLIGADGINSKVRKQLFPKSELRYSGQTCWRGIADLEIDSQYSSRGIEMWGDQIRFGLSRVSKNKVYWFAVATSLKEQKREANVKDFLLTQYKEFHPLVIRLLEKTDPENILKNDINDLKPLDKWFKDKICLIGDAGHATTPNMGQGGAQAIEDAHFLSELIRLKPNENIFNEFQNKRQKKVTGIIKQSWSTGKIAHWKYGQSLRNFLLKSVPNSLVEKKMIEMYSIDY